MDNFIDSIKEIVLRKTRGSVRKPFVAGLVIAFGALITAAFACGDKMLLTVGNLRYRQLSGGAHPAVILAYIRQDSAVPGVVKELEAQPALKQAGHRFYFANDPAKLGAALKSGKYDILLADVSDADDLEQQARSALSRPVVLPVVHKSSKDEANAVERRFHCIVKAPDSPGRYLAAIDKAMELKLKRR